MFWTPRFLGSQHWWTWLGSVGVTGSSSALTTSAAWWPPFKAHSPSGHYRCCCHCNCHCHHLSWNHDLQISRDPCGERIWSLPSCLCSGRWKKLLNVSQRIINIFCQGATVPDGEDPEPIAIPRQLPPESSQESWQDNSSIGLWGRPGWTGTTSLTITSLSVCCRWGMKMTRRSW